MTNATDIRQLLSNITARDASAAPYHVVIDGRTYTLAYCDRTYSIHNNSLRHSGSLIDGGANGGLGGSDVVVIVETLLTADVTGIANHNVQKVPVCTVAALIQTQHGPIIGIFHEYAHHGTGKTIQSVSQLRHFGTIVDNTPHCFTGKQRLETFEGSIIHLSICSGLPYMDMSPATSIELDTYPHEFFTSDSEWNPQSIVDEYPIQDMDLNDNDLQHNYCHTETINAYGELTPQARQQDIHYQNWRKNQPDVEHLSPNFGFVPSLRIQHTLDNTTQFAWLDSLLPMRKHFRSRFPAANASRLNEVVATDTYFSDTPALDEGVRGHGGTKKVQLFCGCQRLLTAVYPMQHEGKISGTISGTLEDFIRQYGAPNSLFRDK
jgi:hypothetical protein